MAPPSALTPAERSSLVAAAARLRLLILETVYQAGSGHIGGALSEVELLVALYYRALRVDPGRPEWPERDRFVLSKGHGGLGLVAALVDRGFVPKAELAGYGRTGSRLGMHLDHRKVPGVELSTGSLGHGLGVAVGMALGARLKGWPSRTVCLLSDGECYEGSTWEAALSAPAYRLGRLVALVDDETLSGKLAKTVFEKMLATVNQIWTAAGIQLGKVRVLELTGDTGKKFHFLDAVDSPNPDNELLQVYQAAAKVQGASPAAT